MRRDDEAWYWLGGGSGGGMDDGNSVAVPHPINNAPGLNSIWVFGENMQAACGLNHQLAVGNNQQICINPAGLMAGLGVAGGASLTGMLGGGSGGNIQLTFGSSVALTMGQAFEINLGPEKIGIDGSFGSHVPSLILCGVLGLAAGLYAYGYGVKAADEDYSICGTYTLIYQAAVDVLLEAIMIYEMVAREGDDISIKAMNMAFGVSPNGHPPDKTLSTGLATLVAVGTDLATAAAIMVPLELASKNNKIKKEYSDQDTADKAALAAQKAAPAGSP